MRRLLLSFFLISGLALGSAGAAPATVHADCVLGTPNCDPCPPTDAACRANAATFTTQFGTHPPDTAAANTSNTLPQMPNLGDGFGQVMIAIMTLFAWLVGVAAIVLDNAVYYTVVTMGTYVNHLSAIGVSWRILRDIANIMLIFGFLAAGIMTILNVEKFGFGTKMLPKLLIAAITINFSLFVAEAMIDGTNLVATQFYTQINGGTITGPKNFDATSIANDGIASKLMNQMGLQTIYGNVQNTDKAKDLLKAGNSWVIGFMAIILFLITAFVMFSLALILIMRFVVLVLLLVVSPVAFMGLALPSMEYRAGKWWENFLEQIITAPVLLILLYVALAVITDVNFLTGFCVPAAGSTNPTCAASWTGFADGSNLAGFGSMMLSFLVAMGLLMVVVIKAKSMGAAGAGWATKIAGKATFGATAWAGRATIGTGIGRGLLGNRLVTRGAVSNNKLIRYGARTIGFAGKRLQNRTYDVRNIPGAGAGLSALHVDAGKPSQLTAKDLQEKQYGVKPVKEIFRESSRGYEDSAKKLDRKTVLSSGLSVDIQKELKKMSADEIAELKGIRNAEDKLVHALSPSAFAELMKNAKLLDSEKKAIRAKWDLQFSTHASAQTALNRMSEEERVALGGPILQKREVYENLTADDLDNIRSAKLQPTEKATIVAYVKAQHAAGIAAGAAATPLQQGIASNIGNPKFKAYYEL